MMKKILFLIFVVFISGIISAHPWKPGHYVIIDTDGGIDDVRAITLLLASPDIRVLGIIVSPGVLNADTGFIKIRSLLRTLHHEGIPVGVNRTAKVKAGNCIAAGSMVWGPEDRLEKPQAALQVMRYVYSMSKDPVEFLCLGSLNTISLALDSVQNARAKTKRILWSNDVIGKNGYNYSLDDRSFKRVSADSVPFAMIVGNATNRFYTDAFSRAMMTVSNVPYAVIQKSITSSSPVAQVCFDEMIPLYLHYPDYFKPSRNLQNRSFEMKENIDVNAVYESYRKIICSETVVMNQVLNVFPSDTTSYMDDVKKIMETTIKSYGKQEWVACVMANELHRHLGVYAVIGVKMGMRAMEYYGAGIDEMSVVSYAGLTPPFSCMNDGLQVSTGATLGHGLISVSADSLHQPAAEFHYMGRTVRMSLNPDIQKKISTEIRELNKIYGLDSNIYWELVRRLAIRYWSEFDRNEIFFLIENN